MLIAGTQRVLQAQGNPMGPAKLRRRLGQFEDVWTELLPAERGRIVGLLVERVDIQTNARSYSAEAPIGLGSHMSELLADARQKQAT